MKKQALVTGATSGIGRATALRLAAEGYDIIATGRRSERLESLRREIEAAGGRCTTLTFDVRSEEAVRRNLEPLGRVDLLVNNAGLAAGLEHIDKERADRVYDGVEPLTGEDIAEAIAWAAQLPAHMTVNEMVLMPSQQAGAYYTHRKN